MKFKRCIILFLLTLNVLPQIFAQTNTPQIGIYSYWDPIDRDAYQYMFLEQNRIQYWINVTKEKSGTYTIDEVSGISFINIQWDNDTPERFLFLISNDFLCLYDGDNNPVYLGLYYNSLSWDIREGYGTINRLGGLELSELQNVKASNSLIEGGVNYSPTPGRLGLHINRAWAVRGGVGESLFGSAMWGDRYRHDSYTEIIIDDQYLYISSGYVSYSKPQLYYENSRPKKIRIYDSDNKSLFMDFELLDTPNFQIIDISSFLRTRREDWENYDYDNNSNWVEYGYHSKIQIEILEIYSGTRFNDTCINSIIYFWGDYQ